MHKDFGRIFDNSFAACAFFFFLKWRLTCTNWSHSLGQDQSTVAQQNEMTVNMCSLMSCMWACFLIDSHTSWTAAYSNFDGSRVYVCLGVTCHLHCWQNDWGLLHAAAVTRGWKGHRIRVSTQSWLWRRKFSRRSSRDSNSQPFDHESGAHTNKLIIITIIYIKLYSPISYQS